MGTVLFQHIINKTSNLLTGSRGKRFFSAGFRELTDTILGKEESAASDHMFLSRRTW
jgi:hypothetical protein